MEVFENGLINALVKAGPDAAEEAAEAEEILRRSFRSSSDPQDPNSYQILPRSLTEREVMHQLLLAWPGSILLLAEPQQRISFLEASAVMDVGDVGDSTAVIIHSSNSLGSIR